MVNDHSNRRIRSAFEVFITGIVQRVTRGELRSRNERIEIIDVSDDSDYDDEEKQKSQYEKKDTKIKIKSKKKARRNYRQLI
jgi:hypothetical protein